MSVFTLLLLTFTRFGTGKYPGILLEQNLTDFKYGLKLGIDLFQLIFCPENKLTMKNCSHPRVQLPRLK